MENMLVNIIFTLAMLALAFWDFLSYGKQKHRDFKSIIISAGVLGTFVGIFMGLQDFDTRNIENSVPTLLEGLKTAFYTSILGMGLAILLSIIQKSKAVKSDLDNMLDYFSLQMGKLDELSRLKELTQITQKQQETLHKTQTLLEKQSLANEERYLGLEEHFNKVNFTLKEAMHHLAQGASKELIGALEGVIRDFNKKITDQFGDNFKELNLAVSQMIAWQNNYKEGIAGLEENLKNTLALFNQTSEGIALIAKRNEETLEVYKALANSIEASRIENEKLSSLLAGFEDMHTHAQNALVSVKELVESIESIQARSYEVTEQSHKQISQIIQSGKEESMELVRSNLENTTQFLEQSTKTYLQNSQNVLENSLQTLEQDHTKLNEQLNKLYTAFMEFNESYITQNQEKLTQSLKELESKTLELLENFNHNEEELRFKNLEMVTHIKSNIQEQMEEIKSKYGELVDNLQEAQKQSVLLLEEQSKRSDDVLLKHSQNMETTLEQNANSFMNLSKNTQDNLQKHLDALEEHVNNAVLSFDKLLGNSTKNLEENLQSSKETLITLSNEVEKGTTDTLRSLNDLVQNTANSLSQSSQNIEEALSATSYNIQENFTKTTQEISQNVQMLLEGNKEQSKQLYGLLEEDVKNFGGYLEKLQSQNQSFLEDYQGKLRGSLAESYKNTLESLNAYLKNANSLHQTQVGKILQTSTQTHQELTTHLQNNLAEIASLFDINSKKVLESANSLVSNLLNLSKTQLDSHSKEVIQSYLTLQDQVKVMLKEMGSEYLEMLSLLGKKSLELPKNVSAELLNEFNKLQKNLGDALTKTYLSLESNRKEIDAILQITKTNVSSSLAETSELNAKLCSSLGELDGALSNITLGFRQDYEWFLRRIRELMGAR